LDGVCGIGFYQIFLGSLPVSLSYDMIREANQERCLISYHTHVARCVNLGISLESGKEAGYMYITGTTEIDSHTH
jgi:hypothetical protein